VDEADEELVAIRRLLRDEIDAVNLADLLKLELTPDELLAGILPLSGGGIAIPARERPGVDARDIEADVAGVVCGRRHVELCAWLCLDIYYKNEEKHFNFLI